MNQNIENMGIAISNKMQHKLDADGGAKVTGIDSLLVTVIQKLIKAKPLWKFVVVEIHALGGKEYKATRFEVLEDGQSLGFVTKCYARRDYRIGVENHRIADAKVRSSSYTTSDPDKAVTTIKKTFRKMDLSELTKTHTKKAEEVIKNVSWEKGRAFRGLESDLAHQAKNWALGDGYSIFLQYVNEKARHLLTTIDAKEVAFSEMMIIDDVTKAYETGKASLIIADGNNFIVKRGDGVSNLSADELTDSTKTKIGMLKLVQDQQFVSSVGAKVSPEAYIVLDEVKDEYDDGN